MKTHIGIGTAQFGLEYGVTNKSGKVNRKMVKEILDLANNSGIIYLDCAQAYGNAEELIGNSKPEKNRFKIVTKLAAQAREKYTAETEREWDIKLDMTLRNLKVENIEGLLAHRAADIKREGGERLINWFSKKREEGKIKKFGVSIYEAEDLEEIDLSNIQIVQLPCSLYDQRLLKNGTIERLKKLNISIHARSVYLQGLIVAPSVKWPTWINDEFKRHHESVELYARNEEISLVDLALGWVKKQKWLDVAIMGVTSTSELDELMGAWNRKINLSENIIRDWAWRREVDLDPRNWNKGN